MNSDESARDRGRRLRAQSTKEEAELWKHLRAKRFGGFKFRRQHRIGHYFADLCCVKRRLIVELDGGQHAEQKEHDAARTAYLTEQGYRVIRFWNEQVSREMNDVLEAIYAALTDL
jgi:very-short-patch-repair endonuclease